MSKGMSYSLGHLVNMGGAVEKYKCYKKVFSWAHNLTSYLTRGRAPGAETQAWDHLKINGRPIDR